jgi:NADPH-dependent 2,4-dienoyl-CoA reductase/sulfur reductase-like enzyme
MMQRRLILQGLISGGALGLAGCASLGGTSANKAKVLVVGGGYGGATVSKYIRLLSDHSIDVMMVEPNTAFVSCPVSNLVIGGQKTMADITNPYTGLSSKHGVRVVHDSVTAVDTTKKTATLSGGSTVSYDKLVLAPGIDFMWDQIQGLREAHTAGQILHAWKAGPETMALRRQLEAMRDGGTYAIVIPEAPYRCPPGPYERASVIAAYFKAAKPRSKVLVLDANPDVTSKGALFKKVWAEQYAGILEYRPQHKAIGVSADGRTIRFEVHDDVRADVANVLPAMRAGRIAVDTGLANVNGRWAGVNYQSFASTVHPDIHVIGDAIQVAPAMPKSGHMANNHAKVAAAAIVAELSGQAINPSPMLTNTCYSYVNGQQVIHVASVYEYVAAEKTFKAVAGSGGLSAGPTEQEGRYAWNWARTIWADALA